MGAEQVERLSVSTNNVAVMDTRGDATGTVLSVDRTGQAKTLSPLGTPINLGMSPDDTHVMVTRGKESLDLWLYDLKRGTASRFTSDPGEDGVPVWSPDGSSVVFASWRAGASDLYIKPANGARNERPLFTSSDEKYPSDWSADGRYILYESTTPETASDLWVLPVSGDGQAGKPEVYLNSEFVERDGRFSPDVRWVAYTSNETGRDEVYVQSFPTGQGKWQISTSGGGKPAWRRDGRELFYLSSDGYMMTVPVTIGGKFAAANPRRLFAVSNGPQSFAAQYAVDRRAETFILISRTNAAQHNNLHIILNWHPELK